MEFLMRKLPHQRTRGMRMLMASMRAWPGHGGAASAVQEPAARSGERKEVDDGEDAPLSILSDSTSDSESVARPVVQQRPQYEEDSSAADRDLVLDVSDHSHGDLVVDVEDEDAEEASEASGDAEDAEIEFWLQQAPDFSGDPQELRKAIKQRPPVDHERLMRQLAVIELRARRLRRDLGLAGPEAERDNADVEQQHAPMDVVSGTDDEEKNDDGVQRVYPVAGEQGDDGGEQGDDEADVGDNDRPMSARKKRRVQNRRRNPNAYAGNKRVKTVYKCTCGLKGGKRCVEQFPIQQRQNLLNWLYDDLERDSRRAFVTGLLHAVLVPPNDEYRPDWLAQRTRKVTGRVRARVFPSFHMRRLCTNGISKLVGMSKDTIASLYKLVDADLNGRDLVSKDREFVKAEQSARVVVGFLERHAAVHGCIDPGGKVLRSTRNARSGEVKVRRLLSVTTKRTQLYEDYCAAVPRLKLDLDLPQARQLSRPRFDGIWKERCAHINIAKPGSDFCDKCINFQRKANPTAEQVRRHHEHLDHARTERRYYRKAIADSREEYKAVLAQCREELLQDKPDDVAPKSLPRLGVRQSHRDFTLCMSFDFAQSAPLPYYTNQPGGIYFKSENNVGIFGVVDDTTGNSYMHIGCEGSYPAFASAANAARDQPVPPKLRVGGKNPNAIISMLHHTLEKHSMGAMRLHLTADNCTGQNKNQYVMQYLAWRVIMGYNTSIKLHFMVAGHTKFSPDRAFLQLKRRMHRTDYVETMSTFEKLVRESSKSNRPIRTDFLAGEVEWRDWRAFLGQFFGKAPFKTSPMHLLSIECVGRQFKIEWRSSSDQEMPLADQYTVSDRAHVARIKLSMQCQVLPPGRSYLNANSSWLKSDVTVRDVVEKVGTLDNFRANPAPIPLKRRLYMRTALLPYVASSGDDDALREFILMSQWTLKDEVDYVRMKTTSRGSKRAGFDQGVVDRIKKVIEVADQQHMQEQEAVERIDAVLVAPQQRQQAADDDDDDDDVDDSERGDAENGDRERGSGDQPVVGHKRRRPPEAAARPRARRLDLWWQHPGAAAPRSRSGRQPRPSLRVSEARDDATR